MGEIVLREINMTLDPASIRKAIRDVEGITLDLKYALDALCKQMLEDGVQIARMQLRGYLSSSFGKAAKGNLFRSIRYEMADGSSGEGYLLAGYPGDHMSDDPRYANISYAVFFEFGFGTSNHYRSDGSRINSTKALKILKAQWLVARSEGRISDHPSGNGQYRKAKEFRMYENKEGGQFRGWVYKDRWTGKFYTVKGGQPPKPFMYKTMLDLAERAEREGGRIIAEYMAGGSGT